MQNTQLFIKMITTESIYKSYQKAKLEDQGN